MLRVLGRRALATALERLAAGETGMIDDRPDRGHRQRRPARGRRGPEPHPARRPARRPRPDRRQGVLPRRRVRRLHGDPGRADRGLLPRPRGRGRRRRDPHGRGPRRARRPPRPLQAAFLDKGAVQCGFCIPGQLLSAHALLEEHPHPTRAEIEEGMAGNLCRCACYEQIFDAIRDRRRRTRSRRRCSVARSPASRRARPNRVGGIDRVTGAQPYLADLRVADALHAKLVTLACARARILAHRRVARRSPCPASTWS